MQSILVLKRQFTMKVAVVYTDELLVCYPKYTYSYYSVRHTKLLEKVTILQDLLKEQGGRGK